MAFIEPTEGEAQSAADIAAARQEFLASPPAILDPDPPAEPVVDDETALLDELTQPPAVQEGAPVSQAAPAPAPAPTGTLDPYAQYGGEEQVRIAAQVQEALRTEQGIRALVANGLTALGYDVDQVRQALDAAEGIAPEQPPANDPFAGFEDDDPITVAQARQLSQQTAEAAVAAAVAQTQQPVQELQQAIAAQQQTAVRATVDAAVVEVLGPIPTDAAALATYRSQVDAIVERGSQYYDASQVADPNHIKQVVQRANTEINAEQEARFQTYLQSKRASRQGQPPNISGGAGTDGPLAEPKTMAEARAQAEKAGFFG